LDKIAKKSGTGAADAGQALTKMDSNGDGSLDATEWAAGMKRLMPAPASTLDFASRRGGEGRGASKGVDKLFSRLDANGSGGLDATELNKLLDKMASASGASRGASSDATAAADAAVFKAIDTNGDGSISKSELATALQPAAGSSGSANTNGTNGTGTAGGMPPPQPAGGPRRSNDGDGDDGGSVGKSSSSGSASGSASTTSTAATDPLDTNGDGVVSAKERAAGALKDLMRAMDANQNGSVSKEEISAFVTQLTQPSDASGAGSASTASGARGAPQGSRGGSARWAGSTLAAIVTSEYTKAAANGPSNSSLNVAA
jgi:Ca2+-binding EF-hand superfamily protein